MIKNTKLYKVLQNRESKYLEQIDRIADYAEKVLPQINRVFANYTGHGIEHSVSVMEYMYDIVTDISQIDDLDIILMICAALLHDSGMIVVENEIEQIRRDELIYQGRRYTAIYKHLGSDNLALQECVRCAHGIRSYFHIMNMDKTLFLVANYSSCNFQEELAKICQAHTMDREWIVKNLENKCVKGEERINPQYIAMLLRIADYLDVDEKRTPLELYNLLKPIGTGELEWKQHFVIENKDKIQRKNSFDVGKVVVYGHCDDARIHRKLLSYLSSLSEEIFWASDYSEKHFEDCYIIKLNCNIDNRIQTIGFEVSNLKMQVDYHAITKLLMGENVYGDKKYGLRELIQNSIDACKLLAEESIKLDMYKYSLYVPIIKIIVDCPKKKFVVMDNGTGMNYDILTNYFLNIGKSYYKSKDFVFQDRELQPIGTFGIGFLSCFMLSDRVTIETKHYLESSGFSIELESDSEYVCKTNRVDFIGQSGTAVLLNLDSVLQVFNNDINNIKNFIKYTFLEQNIQINFLLIDKEGREERIKLKKYDDLIQDGVVLNKYLNGISATVKIKASSIKISKKLSDICLDWRCETNEFYEFDYAEHLLYKNECEGNAFDKYMFDNQLMIIKLEGIIKEKEDWYCRWKEWNKNSSFPPEEIQKNIYFPIRYEKGLLELCEGGTSCYGNGGAVWHVIPSEIIGEECLLSQYDIKKIMKETGIIELCPLGIRLGIVNMRKVGDDSYFEYRDENYSIPNDEVNKTFLNNILLEKGGICINSEIVGLAFGECVINITNKNVSPNIARNDLLNTVKSKMNDAITKACYQYVVDNLQNIELKESLQKFIDSKYCEENFFLR